MGDKEIIDEIKELSKEKIDGLFYRCKWIDKEKGNNKALPDWRIKEIKDDKAEELINTFIQETGIKEIKKNLEEIKND